jgi:outer membrane biosynthesis protein TonB
MFPGASAAAFALMLSAACSSRGPRVIEEHPPLVVPPVPARTIEPPPVTLPPPVEPPVDPPPPPTVAAKPKPTAREPKPEPKPEAPVETGTPPGAVAANPPPPVAPLRTPTTPVGPEAARQIREMLIRAQAILNNVDYQKLNPDRRGAYDLAKSAITSADEALKKDDLLLARSFAERAEVIAKQLEGR